MPAPRFITCQICGRGFGSASIGIHTPQCFDKALKRWQLNPTGPRPVMPASSGMSGGGRAARGGGVIGGFDSVPVGRGSVAARSLGSGGGGMRVEESVPTNVNLHPCAKCGRKFNFDRIAYHESVCKGDMRRPRFNSMKQRMPEEVSTGGLGSSTGRWGKKADAGARPMPRNPRPPPPSKWRQQHEEFIAAVRSARAAEAHEARGSASYGGGSARGTRGSRPRVLPAPVLRRVPAPMVMQDASLRANLASGGRAARAQVGASISTPAPKRAPAQRAIAAKSTAPRPSRGGFGSNGDKFAGYSPGLASGGGGGGGGGGYRIANDNTTSIGMKQALGLA